ncbi:MAG: pyruvate, phosphate dikinase [Candidatus Binatia bacterium]|nr:MAG: pyruvate, phosphate dikinase [Candidatus Binatia bacterium]
MKARHARWQAGKTRARVREKHVYFFGGGKAEGNATMRELLGGKGANLAEMAGLGLPVPPGFTITTEVCRYYETHGQRYPRTLRKEVEENLARVERLVGRRFGDPSAPLLVSVRSGAPASMPGMMDTVLNLGLNDRTVEGLARLSGNERFAYDSYRRFLQMYSSVVLGLKPRSETEPDPFEEALERKKKDRGVELDTDLSAQDLRELVEEFRDLVRRRLGREFPQDPEEQLWEAIGAVFRSWNNPRAVTYRRLNDIPSHWGTAVNVQAMVFGNLGPDCATGVAFTRDPSTGEKTFYGEFLVNAQGEDVVAGIRTPQQITLAASREWARRNGIPEEIRKARYPSLEEYLPRSYRELRSIAQKLERHYRDMQDIEFTIERARLWVLQTRNAKRTARAAVRVAVDMVRERLLDRETALFRVKPEDLERLLHPSLDLSASPTPLTRGLPASPGAARGRVVFSAEEAEREAREGTPVVLVRVETSPEDIHGMHAAQAIVTARGGMTSHAAVVARSMGKCCVVGCGEMEVDYGNQLFRVRDQVVRRGDWISVDGSTGEIFRGQLPLHEPELGAEFSRFLSWADSVRSLGVLANADTPEAAREARKLGAEGIGLCRTEHMFFEPERIDAVREMILADDPEGRRRALEKLAPMQKGDFREILRAMDGLPVTIRLLDPPLHEFLPNTDEEIQDLARKLGLSADALRLKRDALFEFNPMLGHRGCRLGITFPEIYRMQVRAIAEATAELRAEGARPMPEIMIPLVGFADELRILRAEAESVLREVLGKARVPIGTMIELPRAALVADRIAQFADFFSFGTNDLTQTTLGISRDDAGKFLPEYVEKKILPKDPFVTLDLEGVGALVRTAVEKARKAKPGMKLGICGEHGGDPESVRFCHETGLDYVSCSPFRIPVARLAAAQAAIAPARKKPRHP